MGGSCCCQDISEQGSTNVDNPTEISSDWDEVESDCGDQTNGETEGSQQFTDRGKQSSEDTGRITDNTDDTSNMEEIVDEPTVSEEPMKSLYGEEELKTRKQRAFALDLKLYNNTHKS